MGQYGGRMDWSPTRFAAEYEDPITVAIRSVLSTTQSIVNNRQAKAEQKRLEERHDQREFEAANASAKRDIAMAGLEYNIETGRQEKEQQAQQAKAAKDAERRQSLGGLYRASGGMQSPDFNPDTAPVDVLEKAITYAMERNKPKEPKNIDPLSDQGAAQRLKIAEGEARIGAKYRKPDTPADTTTQKQQWVENLVMAAKGDPLAAMQSGSRAGNYAKAKQFGVTREDYYAAAERYRQQTTAKPGTTKALTPTQQMVADKLAAKKAKGGAPSTTTKQPTPAQMTRAQADPEYREYLRDRGYVLP